jgi:drug/metabolite transporter (DMT)-like permease
MTAYLGAGAAFMASVTWAFASTHYAEVARTQGAVRVGLLRAICAATLFSLLAAFEGHNPLQIDAWRGLCLAGSVICSYALGDRVFFASAARIGTSSALSIATIYPLWSALYGTIARGEPLGASRAVGMALCLVGVSAVLQLSRGATPRRSGASGSVLGGAGLALLTSLFWAGNTIFLKLGAQGIAIYQANAFRFGCGVLLLLVQLLPRAEVVVGERLPFGALARKLWLPLFADTGVGGVCFIYGIANTDLALGATLSSLSPLVALPFAVMLGTERVSIAKAAAVCVTLLGVVLLVVSARA